MFTRIKKSGQNQYLQLIENRREGKKTVSGLSPPSAVSIRCTPTEKLRT